MKNQILQGDVIDIIKTLSAESVNCIITSPPYFGLRNYGLSPAHWPEVIYAPMAGLPKITIPPMSCCFGLEDSIEAYVGHMVLVWRELWRVLRGDGVAFLNLGDSYAGNRGYQVTDNKHCDVGNNHGSKIPNGLKPKDLIGIPWRCAFALQADGWYLRSDVIWAKKNPMPESVTDRPTKAHEYVFLLAKSERYWWDQEAIREPIAREWDDKNIGLKNMSTTGIAEGKILGRKTMPNNGLVGTMPNPAGRNKRTVWSPLDEIAEHNELLAFILVRLASDRPELLGDILDEYGSTPDEKSDVWELATKPYKAAHFAVMPEALVEPCLLAGCPAQVCVECGESWVRVVEKNLINTEGYGSSKKNHHITPQSTARNNQGRLGDTKIITIAHTPACQCCPLPAAKQATRPGVALDPFFGSGTVGVVARKNKRDWAGIELNPGYIELARTRLDQTQPALFAR